MEETQTYNGNGTVRLEESVQLLEKLESKEINGLGAAGKDVVHNVVEARAGRVVGQLLGVAARVGQDGLVILS